MEAFVKQTRFAEDYYDNIYHSEPFQTCITLITVMSRVKLLPIGLSTCQVQLRNFYNAVLIKVIAVYLHVYINYQFHDQQQLLGYVGARCREIGG